MATLREVAKLASVSTATVSKVLSNTPYVSEETRARVLQAINALNYVPNLAARALSHGRTYNIGVIFPYHYDHLFADPLMLTVLEGVENICTREGYNILLSTPRSPITESEQYQRLVRSGYLDGVIMFETLPGNSASTLIAPYDYPDVTIGGHTPPGTTNAVQLDDFGGAKALADYILGLGHRRVGIVGIEAAALIAADERMAGYRAAFAEVEVDFALVPRVVGKFSIESGYQAAHELLERAPDLTAIICLNDRMAMGAIQCVWARGLRVPEDISVAGFDDIPGAAYFAPPLTTVRQPAKAMGEKAAEILFEAIAYHTNRKRKNIAHKSTVTVQFATELIIRASVAAPRTAFVGRL